jgi:hypothetical protein
MHSSRSDSASASAEPPGGKAEADTYPALDVRLSSKHCSATRAGDVSSFTCPQGCRVACCAQEDAEYNKVQMSHPFFCHPFWRCSVQACSRSCGFKLVIILRDTGPYTQRTVAIYLAQKSRGKPVNAAATRKGGGSGSGCCTGSLC